MRFYIALPLLLIATVMGNLHAQNVVKGKVSDELNEPIAGAHIYIPMLLKGTVSNSKGEFVLNNLPNGKFDLQISHIGYANSIISLNMLGGEEVVVVQLQPASIEAESVVVSSGFNSTQHRNAVKIDIVKLNERHLISSPNFMEMLTSVPGVDMISKGTGVSKPVIRGLSMNDVLVLSNGVRFENYQYSSHHPLGIDEFGIEAVEVIKGPASLLYGSDAIGGVINFIKERPAGEGSMEGDYGLQMFSNSEGVASNIGIKASNGPFHGGFRLGIKSHADYLQGGGQFVPNSRFYEHSAKFNSGFSGKSMATNLYYDYYVQNIGLVEEEAVEQIENRGRKPTIFYQKFGTHLLSSQSKIFLGRSKVDINASLQATELTHLGEENEYELQMRLTTLIYESKFIFPSKPGNDFIVGFQGISQRNTNLNDRETILLPNALTSGFSVFGLAQQSLGKLRFQAGLRYDRRELNSEEVGAPNQEGYRPKIERNFKNLTGSSGLTYKATDDLLFRINVAAAFRNPNLAELTSNGPHETRFEVGSVTLKPEKSLEYDISAHYHIGNVLVDLAGFHNTIYNYIHIAPSGQLNNGLPEYKYLQNDSFLTGGEVGSHLHPLKWLHFGGNYSIVYGKKRDGGYLPFIPASKVVLETGVMGEKFANITNPSILVNFHYALPQNRTAADETSTPAHGIVNISFRGVIILGSQPFEVGLSILNLFDQKYIDHLSSLKEVGYFNPGRNFTFNLRIPFRFKIG